MSFNEFGLPMIDPSKVPPMPPCKPPKNQTKDWLKQEIEDRLSYFYKQIDGSYNFPNSAEGDILKMVHRYFRGEKND